MELEDVAGNVKNAISSPTTTTSLHRLKKTYLETRDFTFLSFAEDSGRDVHNK